MLVIPSKYTRTEELSKVKQAYYGGTTSNTGMTNK